MKTAYPAKADLAQAINCLEGADLRLSEIVYHLDLEWGPDASSGLAIDVHSIQRHVTTALSEARALLNKNKGKLALRKRR